MPHIERRGSDNVIPASSIIEIWPQLRPHVREAIVTLIDADLIQARLQQDGAFLESAEQFEFDSTSENRQP